MTQNLYRLAQKLNDFNKIIEQWDSGYPWDVTS